MDDLKQTFCAQLANHEPQFGTASEAKVWLLLEYTAEWRTKAVTDNDLPASVQTHLQTHLDHITQSRLLFIKREKRPLDHPIHFYLVFAAQEIPVIYAFTLPTYEALLDLDIAGMVAGDVLLPDPIDEPLWLVCTNGKRDQCCAKFGLPVYRALKQIAGNRVWQTTHIGGHQYAPTLLVFPTGLCYGRVVAGQVAELVEAEAQGKIYRPWYRGCVYHSPIVQVADHFWRESTGVDDLNAYQLEEFRSFNDRESEVVLVDDQHRYSIRLQHTLSEVPHLVGCTHNKSQPIPQYDLTLLTTTGLD